MGISERLHFQVVVVKRRHRHHEDGRVDKKGAVQRDQGIHQVVFASLTLAGRGVRKISSLNECRVKVEIVRHDRGPEHANGDIQTAGEANSVGSIEDGEESHEHVTKNVDTQNKTNEKDVGCE